MRRVDRLWALLLVAGCFRSKAPELPHGTTPAAPSAATEQPAALPAGSPDGGATTTEPSPESLPSKVHIVIRATPAKAKLKVYWGKKLLGVTPLDLYRPRDSGPMDLVVRGAGVFPVHIRAYTYKNDTLYVKPTKLEDRMTLLGAKQELPPPEAAPAQPLDAGVP